MDDLDVLQSKLRNYILEDKRKIERQHTKNVAAVYGLRPDDDGQFNVTHEIPKVQPTRYPELLDDNNGPRLKLFFYNLPRDISNSAVRNKIASVCKINLKECRVVKNRRGFVAFVECYTLSDSYEIQVSAREKQLVFNECGKKLQFVKVVPQKQQKSSMNFAPINFSGTNIPKKIKVAHKNNDNYRHSILRDYLSDISIDVLELMLSYLSFDDQLALMLSSKKLLELISDCHRNLIINTDKASIKPISDRIMRFWIQPHGVNCPTTVKRIILNNQQKCKLLDPLIIQSLVPPGLNFSLVELNISSITVSSEAIVDIAHRCPQLRIFLLGNTSGSCDFQMGQLFADGSVIKSLKTLGISNNNYFTGSVLTNDNIVCTSLILDNCQKLHANHIQQVKLLLSFFFSVFHMYKTNFSICINKKTYSFFHVSVGHQKQKTLVPFYCKLFKRLDQPKNGYYYCFFIKKLIKTLHYLQ